jgi:uncharacterized protein (TIGR02996 family)
LAFAVFFAGFAFAALTGFFAFDLLAFAFGICGGEDIVSRAMSNKRMFELSEGVAAKFWEVWRDGSTVVTRFGRVGGAVQTKLKEAGSDADADHVIDAQIRDKTAKGYVEYGGAAPTKITTTVDMGSLDEQLANLTDDASHLVLADWLQAQGHPWGELITLQHAAMTEKNAKKRASLEQAAAQHLEQHGATILGSLAGKTHSHFDWHLGMLRTAKLETGTAPSEILEAVKTLLALPAARKLEGIVLSPIPTNLSVHRDWDASSENVVDPWTELLDELVTLLPARITHLGFGGWPVLPAAAYVRLPSFTTLTEKFPNLRKLEMTGWSNDEPGELAMKELVDLDVRFVNANTGDIRALTASELLKLERLSITCGGQSYCVLDDIYSSEDGYPDSFDNSDLEALEVHSVSGSVYPDGINELLATCNGDTKNIGVRSLMFDADGWQAILANEQLAHWDTLDFSGGNIDDDIAKVFIAAKKSLAHLKVLDLERNCMSAATAKKVAAALPNAKVGDQRKSSVPEVFARYVAVME